MPLHPEKDICLSAFQIFLLVLLSSLRYLEVSTIRVTRHNDHSCDIVAFNIYCLLKATLRSQHFGSTEENIFFSEVTKQGKNPKRYNTSVSKQSSQEKPFRMGGQILAAKPSQELVNMLKSEQVSHNRN